MTNLKDIYKEINNCLDDLYDYEMYSGYINLVNNLSKQIDALGAYFGVRMLKVDVGPFKKYEMVYILQDEGGAKMVSIDCNDERHMDLFNILTDDLFY